MSIELQRETGVETLPFDEFERLVRQGEVPPETLVRMEVLTGKDFKPVGELELYLTLADPEDLAYARRLRNDPPVVTALLVGIQLRIYLWSKAPGAGDWLVDNVTNWAPAILESGEVFRLISYGGLHMSLTHLVLNMLFLGYAGWNLERAMGRRNLLAVFLFAVLAGGLVSMVMSPGRPSLGASGGDFGLIAAAVVFGWKNEDRLPAFARKYFGWAILPYLVYPLCLGLLSTTVDNWGHLGGLIGGAAMATWLQPDGFKRFEGPNRIVRRLAVAVSLLTLGALFAWGPRIVHLEPRSAPTGLSLDVPAGWHEGWAFTEDRGWTSPTREATLVATTKTYRRPLSPEEAVEALVAQVEAGGHVRRHDVRSLEVGGWPAREIEFDFELGGELLVMHALVVVEGPTVHRVHLHGSQQQARRSRLLAEHVFATVRVQDPEALIAAREKAARNPRSWKTNLKLAHLEALYGYPEASWEAYRRAYRDSSERKPEIAAAILDLYADYGEGPEPERVDQLIDTHWRHPAVAANGADALDRMGRDLDAIALLDEAWEATDGDFVIRRARASRGLSVESATPLP